jgi:hypothetical protein
MFVWKRLPPLAGSERIHGMRGTLAGEAPRNLSKNDYKEALIKSVRGEPFDFAQDRPVEP